MPKGKGTYKKVGRPSKARKKAAIKAHARRKRKPKKVVVVKKKK